MIQFSPKTVACFFLGAAPANGVDWLAAIHEIEPDSLYGLVWRFRYYKDDKAFESNDRRSWMSAEIIGTRLYAIEGLRHVANLMRSASDDPDSYYEYINDAGFDVFMRKIQDAPFMYMKQVSKEEGERILREYDA